MKIGILTYHQAINFGAVLQLYALSKYIENVTDKETQVSAIQYEDENLSFANRTIPKKGLKSILRSLPYFIQRKNKIKKFKDFKKNELNFTEPLSSLRDLNFDIVIVGSDQVWNTDINKFDGSYIFENLANIKKTSYAASIGKSKLNDLDLTYFKNLEKFSAISVREESSKKLLNGIDSVPVHVDLDPTLLLEKKDWLSIIPHNNSKEQKYILVYKLQDNTVLDNTIEKLASITGLSIRYVMPQGNSFIERSSTKFSLGPLEFLELIANSEYVVTNSFHGTCFSILFEKPFFTIPHKTRGGRMVDLLEKLDLDYRLQYSDDEFESIYHRINNEDYAKANQKLQVLRKKSQNYIIENILN